MSETGLESGARTMAKPGVRRGARIALLVAAVLSLGLVVWAFTFPAYQGLETRGGVTTETTSTLIEVNGSGAIVPILVPLVVTALVAVLLLRVREPVARVGAWALVGLLTIFAVLAMFSIGMYVLPVAIALAVAVAWPRAAPEAT